MKKYLFSIIIVLSATVSFSQEKINYIQHDSISKEITNLAGKSEYQKIIDLIDKVSQNDSIYSTLQINKSYYLMQLKEYEEAIKVCQHQLKKSNRDESLSFFINQSISYMHLKEHKKALESIDQGLVEFPKSYKLFYHKGVIYHDMKQINKALEMYKISALLNPFNAQVHLKIGNICYKQQLTAQAMMCFNTYLMLNPDGAGAFDVLNSLNKIIAADNINEKIEGLVLSKDDAAFEEIDLILDNRIAMNSDYIIDNEINISFVKQNHGLLQALNSFEGNGGFWDTYYVSLHQWVAKNNYFDNFIYTTTFSIKNEKFKKVVDKHRDDVIEFYSLFKNKMLEVYQENEILFDGDENVQSIHYSDYELEGMGSKKNGNTVGKWVFFDKNGKLKSRGSYNEKGQKSGDWIWYYKDGSTKETASYKSDSLEGSNIAYYDNGNIKYTTTYTSNLLDGTYKAFNTNGAMEEKKSFNLGKLNGIYKSFYGVGESAQEYIVNYNNDTPIDQVLRFSPEGRKVFEVNYIDGQRHGEEKNYYENDSIEKVFDMVKGQFEGPYKEYYSNGVVFQEGAGLEGMNTGTWKTYYPDGKIQSEYQYKRGELDGIYEEFAPDGKLYYQFNYRNGELIAYKYFNKDGSTLKEAKKKGGEFFYEGYAVDGTIITQGLYNVEGGKDGVWKFYSDHGVISSKGLYKNGIAEGHHYEYYNDGKIESKGNYVNGNLEGYYSSYYNSGKMYSQGYYLAGNQDKEWRYYYQDGTLKSINFYHKGKFHGEQKNLSIDGKISDIKYYEYGSLLKENSFDVNMKLIAEIVFLDTIEDFKAKINYPNHHQFVQKTYKNNVAHGPFIKYDLSGNKITEGNYLNGNLSGKWTWYYSNGNKKREGYFINGNYHGVISDYYENGNIEDQYEYNMGSLINQSISFAEDGKTVIGTVEYLNGESHGKRIFYSMEGTLQLIRYYEYGKLVGYSYLNKDDELIPMIEIQRETGKIVSYFQNGHIAREMEFLNGEVVNDYKSYHENGNLARQHFNINGETHGKQQLYYSNGKIKEENEYSYGEKNGYSKKYYSNGQLKEIVQFLNDGKNGEATYYNDQGSLIKVEKYFNDVIYEQNYL